MGPDTATLSVGKSMVASIRAAFDATNPTGIADGAVDATKDVRGIANLVRAIRSGNPSAFNFEATDLAILTAQGTDSALYQPGTPGSGVLDKDRVTDTVASLAAALARALDYGDVARSLSAGLMVANDAVNFTRDNFEDRLASLTEGVTALKALINLGRDTDGALTAQMTACLAQMDSIKGSLGALDEINLGIGALVNGFEAIQAFIGGDILDGVLDGLKMVASIVALLQPELAPVIFAVVAVVS